MIKIRVKMYVFFPDLHSLHFGVRELVEECEEYCPCLIKKGEIV